MKQLGISVNTLIPQAEVLRAEGASVMYLAADEKLLGLLAVSESNQSKHSRGPLSLEDSGLRIIMATGDGLTTAKSVGARGKD